MGKNKLFHHDRHSIMPIWSRAQSALRGFGDKPSGEGVGGLPEPGAAGAGEGSPLLSVRPVVAWKVS